jgi:uncharacterized cofD-like protein
MDAFRRLRAAPHLKRWVPLGGGLLAAAVGVALLVLARDDHHPFGRDVSLAAWVLTGAGALLAFAGACRMNFRWLRPGSHLKRWILAIGAGLLMTSLGGMLLALALFDLGPADWNVYDAAWTLLGVGVLLTAGGVYRLTRRIEKILKRADEHRSLGELAHQQRLLEQGRRIVCFGGGTGLSTLLSGMRAHSRRITAVVSVADDGGSSGRLRHDFDMLPPGDIRNCLVALSDAGPVMARLLQYRFDEGEFAGHSFGNLFITVLMRLHGDFDVAIREANQILNVPGRVLPASLDKMSLVASHPDGTKTTGQKNIALCGKPIVGLDLKPQPGDPAPDVLEAIGEAEVVVVGPGSLYTSILPNFIDPRVAAAVSASPAKVIFVVNTADQPGETRGFKVSDYLAALARHAPGLRVDAAVVNAAAATPAQRKAMRDKGVGPTEYDKGPSAAYAARVHLAEVIDDERPWRHDPARLAAAVMEAAES